MPGSLMERTHAHLIACDKSLPNIYHELRVSGVENVSFYWLRKFYYSGMKDPSVNKVQALHEFLTQTTLPVI